MARWTQTYESLVRERFPDLLAYAFAFTQDETAARDLAERALTRTFTPLRGPRDVAAAEQTTRAWIARLYVADAAQETPDHAAAARADASAGVADDAQAAVERLKAYAPGGATRVAVEAHGRDLPTAVGDLAPRVRGITLLRLVDSLSTPAIADLLELRPAEVRAALAEARARLRSWAGVDVEELGDEDRDLGAIEVTVMPHGGGR